MHRRILHICYSGTGGTGEVAVQLAVRADRQRFTSAVCFFGDVLPAAGFCERLQAAQIAFTYIPLRGALRSLRNVVRECARAHADVIVAHGAVNALALPFARLLPARPRCVAVFHGPPSLARKPRELARWLPGLAAAHQVVCVARHLADALRFGSRVIPNATDAPSEPALVQEATLLMVATLSPAKDHATLLLAVSILANRGVRVRLELAGNGIRYDELRRRAQSLGITHDVEFAGAVSSEETALRLRRAAVVVYATHEEGCPLAVLDAMAAAKPIVATHAPGISGLLENGRTALLVPPGDAPAMANAIEKLLNDRDLAAKLGNAARSVSIENHSPARWLGAWESVFAQP